jgi:hypothetical protein
LVSAVPEPDAYRHDPAAAAIAARIIDSAHDAASRAWDVSDHVRAQASDAGLELETPLVRELVFVVSYRLRLEHGGKPGCSLKPSTDTESFAWPPRIPEVQPDVVALWRDVETLVQHPGARARFNDLLFERRSTVPVSGMLPGACED